MQDRVRGKWRDIARVGLDAINVMKSRTGRRSFSGQAGYGTMEAKHNGTVAETERRQRWVLIGQRWLMRRDETVMARRANIGSGRDL